MNLPNKLTLFRIFTVIPFAVIMGFAIYYSAQGYALSATCKAAYMLYAGGAIFVIAMITDALDGHIARKNKQITTFGKLFDPLADKFMTTTAFITLSVIGIVPFWLTIVFVLRDILVDGSRNLAAANNVKVAASIYGKLKTVFQTIGIAIVLFLTPLTKGTLSSINPSWEIWVINIPLFIAGGMSIFSGYLYLKQIKPYLNVK